MKTGNVLLGIVAGAAAGLAAGVLFAPKRGADTRQQIADRSNDYINVSKNRLNDMVNSVSHSLDNLKSKTMGKKKHAQAEMNGDDKIIY